MIPSDHWTTDVRPYPEVMTNLSPALLYAEQRGLAPVDPVDLQH